ncbi:MAG: AsmA family protein [Acetobacter papayae]
MGLKRKIGLLAGAAVLLVGGGSIVSATQDADWLRTRLVDAVQIKTGRSLHIGTLHVWILPYPWVEARDVTLSGAGGLGEDVLAIGQVRARLSLLPLFSHRVIFRSVSIVQPRVRLHNLPDGAAAQAVAQDRSDDTQAASGPTQGQLHWNFGLSDCTLTQADISWDDQQAHLAGALKLSQARLTGLDGAMTDWNVEGEKGHGHFVLTGQTGPLLSMGEAPLPLALRLALKVDGRDAGMAHLDGALSPSGGQEGAGWGYRLTVGGSLAQLADLNVFFPHADLPAGQNVSVDLALDGKGDQPGIQRLHARIGALDIGRWLQGASLTSLSVDANSPADPVALHLVGQVGGQPVSIAGSAGVLGGWSARPQELPVDLSLEQGAAHLHVSGVAGVGHSALDMQGELEDLAPDAALPALKGVRVNAHVDSPDTLRLLAARDAEQVLAAVSGVGDVSARSLTWQGTGWSGVVAHVVAQAGQFSLAPLTAQGSGIAQAARVDITPAADGPHFAVQLNPVMLPLSAVQTWLGLPQDMRGNLLLVGSVSAQGRDTATRRQTLAGHIGASVVDGGVSATLIKALLGPQAPRLNGWMPVRCFGAHMQFGDDVAHINPLGLQSDFVQLDGNGSVAMGSGALDLHLSPRIQLGAASAASRIRVGGTVSAPLPALDTDAGGRYGVTIGGDDGSADSCPALLSAVREGVAGPAAPPKKSGKGEKIMNLLQGLGLFR